MAAGQKPARQSQAGRRVSIYEHPKSGDIFTIPDPDLHLDQLEAVQRDVAHLLEHGLPDPPTPLATAPPPQDAPPVVATATGGDQPPPSATQDPASASPPPPAAETEGLSVAPESTIVAGTPTADATPDSALSESANLEVAAAQDAVTVTVTEKAGEVVAGAGSP